LRVIDWFITRYCKKFRYFSLTLKDKDKSYDIPLYINYKAQLKTCKKIYFDPFKRHNKFNFIYNDITIATTIGQLTFFKWLFENKIYDYMIQNIDQITKDMKELKFIKHSNNIVKANNGICNDNFVNVEY
jgi:hypothetical protein